MHQLRRNSQTSNQNIRRSQQNLEDLDYTSRRHIKRNYTSMVKNSDTDPHSLPIRTSFSNQQVIKFIVNSLTNQVDIYIQKIQEKRLIKNAVSLTSIINRNIQCHLNPYESSQNQCIQPQQQPSQNVTDPISGFNKINLIKKNTLKKFQNGFQQQNQKKQKNFGLLPMIKQTSLSKLRECIPLQNQLEKVTSKNFLIQEMFRDRLFKQIQNRKIKERLSQFPKNNQQGNAKSLHEAAQMFRQDCNFDYDGQKIGLFSRGGIKNPLKILKTQYKVVKDNVGKNKLQKKAFEKLSFVARTSKVYLQNFKSIDEFQNTNYSSSIKEKIQVQLRRAQVSFLQKETALKQKDKRVV